MVAAIRPHSIDFALLVHVLGAMVLVGGLVTASAQAIARLERRAPVTLRRLSYRTLLVVAFPGYIVMRIGAQWVESKEHLDNADIRLARHRLHHRRRRRPAAADRADPRRHRPAQVAQTAVAAACSRRAA